MPYNLDIEEAKRIYAELNLEFVRPIGGGGLGMVFEVIADGERRALKTYPEDCNTDRLRREAQAMMATDSPYIAKAYDFGVGLRINNRAYILQEFIEGQDLQSVLSGGIIYEEREGADFLHKLLTGLKAILTTSSRIIHRDLKPSNIMVRTNSDPVIIDFGSARFIEETSISSTNTYGPPFTQIYAAPEQWERGNKRLVNEKTDLFAVGIVAYQMFTGQHPFLPEQFSQWDIELIMKEAQALNMLHELNPSVSEKTSKLIHKMMRREQFRRPHLDNVIEELLEIRNM